MATNFTTLELGTMLGQNMSGFNAYKDDFVETEELADLSLYFTGTIELTGVYTVSSWGLGTSSFVIDHPVYGYINSPTLAIDGAHAFSSSLIRSGVL